MYIKIGARDNGFDVEGPPRKRGTAGEQNGSAMPLQCTVP
jgi:hypothetical protein